MKIAGIALATLVFASMVLGLAAAEEKVPPPQANGIILDVPVAEVWEVFTTAEGWKLLGVAKAEVDFRVGGKIRTHYDPARWCSGELTRPCSGKVTHRAV